MKVKVTNLKERNTWIQGKLIEPKKSRIIDVPRVDLLKSYSHLKIEEVKEEKEKETVKDVSQEENTKTKSKKKITMKRLEPQAIDKKEEVK